MVYLITFACYGARLHGNEAGSVDRAHNVPGTPILELNEARAAREMERMDQPRYVLDAARRQAVMEAMGDVCAHRGWKLLAAHVRSNHAHAVVDAGVAPEQAMHDLKSYASRRINGMGLDGPERKRWARHGSTRWLRKPEDIAAAIRYVVDEQGRSMSAMESDE